MKRTITNLFQTFVIVFAFTNCSTQKKEDNDLTENGYRGKVKSVRHSMFEAKEKFGNVEKGAKNEDYFYVFNDKGNLIESNEFNSDGSFKKGL